MLQRAASLLALLFVLGEGACGGIGTASFSEPGSPTSADAGDDSTGDAGASSSGSIVVTADAGGAPSGDIYINNPLCGVKKSGTGGEGQCHPWDMNEPDASTPPNESCLSLLHADGGNYACHVVVNPDGGAEPTCLSEGVSTSTCSLQEECKAGYECVKGTVGENGACRRYCCEPTVCDAMSFCDVRPIVGGARMVPVCVPVVPCDLLDAAQCPGRTCGVADPSKGTTSCVDIGPRLQGEECETEHCAKDLACLGAAGARKCFKLCDTANPRACASDQKCLTNGVTFRGANVGVCSP